MLKKHKIGGGGVNYNPTVNPHQWIINFSTFDV